MGSPPAWYNYYMLPYEYHTCCPLRWWASGQQREHVGVKGQTAHSCIRISSEIHPSMFFISPRLILIMSICTLPKRGQSLVDLKEQFTQQNTFVVINSPSSFQNPSAIFTIKEHKRRIFDELSCNNLKSGIQKAPKTL